MERALARVTTRYYGAGRRSHGSRVRMVQLNLLPVGSAYLYMPHFYVALIAEGTNTTLKEKDVWRMSVTMRARPVFRKFMTIKTGGLSRGGFGRQTRRI